MNKTDRVLAALAGAPVDRPPYGLWYHFGLQHEDGHALAEVTFRFYREYDPDFVKLMHDFPYDPPVPEVRTPADLEAFRPRPGDDGGFARQLRAVAALATMLKGEAFVIDTIFSPWTLLRKFTGRAAMDRLLRERPEAVEGALDAIARSLAAYVGHALKAGLSGIFYSAGAAEAGVLTDEEYRRFCRPADLAVLGAAANAPFNVLHIHGRNIRFDRFLDYPAPCFSWSSLRTAPSLAEARRLRTGCLMGGIDEEDATSLVPSEIRRQVRQAVAEAGSRGLIVAPGCAFPTNISPVLLHALADEVKQV